MSQVQERNKGYRQSRKTPPPQDTQIAWCNVGKSQPAHITLLQLCFQARIDIIQVQEPWTSYPTRTQNHPGYESYAPIDSWTHENERPRVISYIRKEARLEAQQRRPVHSRDLLWLDINKRTYLNFYRRPQTKTVLEYLTNLIPLPRCTIGGDANAIDESWEPGALPRNDGARHIAQWARDNNMTFTGEIGKATHRAGHVLDLVFSNIPFTASHIREDLSCGSDHKTQVTLIPGRGHQPQVPRQIQIRDGNLGLFRNLIQSHLATLSDPGAAGSPAAIDMWIDGFNALWIDCFQAASTPSSQAHTAPWWTKECDDAKRYWKEELRSTRGSDLLNTSERRHFHATVRQAKKDFWRRQIDGISDDKGLYRIVKWHRLGPSLKSPPLNHEGRMIENTRDKAEALAESITKRFTEDDDLNFDPLEGWDPREVNPRLDCTQLATKEEVEAHTIGVSSTSPGVDKTTVRLLRACWDCLHLCIMGLFNQCLKLAYYPKGWRLAEVVMLPKAGKTDLSTYRSWRPIALISCLAKGLERIMAKRMAWAALREGIISPQHAGAIPGRSATDLVASFIHDTELALKRGQHVSLVTMDVQGAYDALLKRRLLQRMRQQGWPMATLRLVEHFLSNRSIRVRLEGTTTAPMAIGCGTPQGSPWSGVLYLLYLAELLNKDRHLRFGYADDLALYRTGSSLRLTTHRLQKDVKSVLQWGTENKVHFAPEKCELQHFTRRGHTENPVLRVNRDFTITPTLLEVKNSHDKQPALRWLGVWMDRHLTWRRHLSERCSKASRCANHLRSLANMQRGPPASALRKATITCVLSSLLYGAEIWYKGTRSLRDLGNLGTKTTRSTLVQQVQRVIDTAARAILPVWRTTPSRLLCRDAGLPSALVACEEKRLWLALRTLKVDNTHPLARRTTLRQGHKHRKRRRGRTPKPYTGIQLGAREYGDAYPLRPLPAGPRYTLGSRTDPTEGLSKKQATAAFHAWWTQRTEADITVFTDGSKGDDGLGYGFVVYRGSSRIDQGNRAIHPTSTVFDAEAIGAWRGLEKAIQHATFNETLTICLDNTAVIWCLRGQASDTSQWAFLQAHEAATEWDIMIKWSPGHMGIQGNEEADELAKAGQRATMDPQASNPTLAGIAALRRRKMAVIRARYWESTQARLSNRYKSWQLEYKLACPPELQILTRRQLHALLALRHGHGDFDWYHTRYQHHLAIRHCSCGALKTPGHLIECSKTRRLWHRWPWPEDRLKLRPETRLEKQRYLQYLVEQPKAFQAFLQATKFYTDICPPGQTTEATNRAEAIDHDGPDWSEPDTEASEGIEAEASE